MDSKEFQEILKTIVCLSYDEFMFIYGDRGEHIWSNYIEGRSSEDRLSHLLKVDAPCAQQLLDYVTTKIAKRS